MSLQTGDTMKNGALVLHAQNGFALCYVEGAVQPYVTWCADDQGNGYHGHYYVHFFNAVADLADRTGAGPGHKSEQY